MSQVKVLYDFAADPEFGELPVTTGEILTVTNKDVGEGWWYGTNINGEAGIFPIDYVEAYDVDNDDSASANVSEVAQNPLDSWIVDDPYNWDDGNVITQMNDAPQINVKRASNDHGGVDRELGNQDRDDSEKSFGSRNSSKVGSLDNLSINVSGKRSSPTAKGNFNRLSTFVKSGGEDFILGKVDVEVHEDDIIRILDNGEGSCSWLNDKPVYSCTLSCPRMGAKFYGLKSYTSYQLTPSFSGLQVSRRFKQFDWVHHHFTQKFPMIAIPPLPSKQALGRYEDEFIEHRMKLLQGFVNRMCSHPILSQTEVWKCFISCTDENQRKAAKRKAEKDPLVGGNLFKAIQAPDVPLDQEHIKNKSESFLHFTQSLNNAAKNLMKISSDQTEKYRSNYKRDFIDVSDAFHKLGESMEHADNPDASKLKAAVTLTGESYRDIANLTDEQPRKDWQPLGDTMHEHSGILDVWTNILKVHSGALIKDSEVDQMIAEGKMRADQASEIGKRSDVISYSLLAEINNFDSFYFKEIREAHQAFLQEQISYHQAITEKLKKALHMFDDC